MSGSNLAHASRRAAYPLEPTRRADRIVNRARIIRNVIVMGASAGGIEVLIRIFSEIPPDLKAVVGVVLHRAPMKSELMHVLGKKSALQIIEPSHDMKVETGVIFLAPPDHHIEFTTQYVTVRRGPKEHSTRPAIDPLFRSAARSFGNRVVGLLLTGGGDDGVNGLIAIKGQGGMSLVQEPEDSAMPYMPMNAIRYDNVDGILRIKEIAPALIALAKGEAVEC
jgi:two-component system, chemotaxis family, protein-glutamate methylesterase/glutaminase